MVAVTHREADKFIAGSLTPFDLFLIFGTDAGLISERSSAILKRLGLNPANPDQINKIEGDEVASNPGYLFEEAHAIGLFAEKRAIILRPGARQIISAMQTILESPAADCKIIVQAGVLRRDAPLRVLATRAKNAAAIECYPDQARDIERLIDNEVKSAGMSIDAAARNALAGLLGDDRLSSRAEIEKLILYAHGKDRITEEDVIHAVADASAFAMDNIIYAAFSGDVGILGDQGSHVYATTSEIGGIIAAAYRHANMLNQLRVEVDNGSSVDSAIERSAARSVFGARKEALTAQVKTWRRDALVQCIVELNQTTLDSRRESGLANAIGMQSLLMIARRFRALRNSSR